MAFSYDNLTNKFPMEKSRNERSEFVEFFQVKRTVQFTIVILYSICVKPVFHDFFRVNKRKANVIGW